MKDEIINLRLKIDSLYRLQKESIGQSSEMDKANTELLLAKAWLGKVLGVLGKPTPYNNEGKRKSVKDIKPTAQSEKDFHIISEIEWFEFNNI